MRVAADLPTDLPRGYVIYVALVCVRLHSTTVVPPISYGTSERCLLIHHAVRCLLTIRNTLCVTVEYLVVLLLHGLLGVFSKTFPSTMTNFVLLVWSSR